MGIDSPLAICALLLCAVAALAWRFAAGGKAQLRLNLRFAAVLFAALGVAGVAAALAPAFRGPAFAIAMLVVALAAPALALSLFNRAPPLAASAGLTAGLAAGMASVLGDAPLFALLALTASVLAMMILASAYRGGLKAAQIFAGSLGLFGGGMALLEGALTGALILFAAGLLGLASASQAGVQTRPARGLGPAVSGPGLR